MKLEIKETKENSILKRKEITGTIIFQGGTPTNKDAAKEIAGQLKTGVECVVMKHIYTDFGKQIANFEAYVYESKEQKEKIEPKTKKDRDAEKKAKEEAKKKAEEAKAAAEKPAEEKPAEKKEEKVEEKKEETKAVEEKSKVEEKKEEKPSEEKKEEEVKEEKKPEGEKE